MTTWEYWSLFAIVALIFVVGMPVVYWLELRTERRDSHAWNLHVGSSQFGEDETR